MTLGQKWARFTGGDVMKRISTPYMFSVKAMPFAFVGLMVFILALMLLNGAYEKSPALLLMPCGMAFIGYHFAKMNSQGLVDAVYDCGDCILVRKRGDEEKIPLANIINVNFNAQPSRITLTLATPGKFGAQILFAPPPQVYVGPLPENGIAADLLVPASQARRSARSS
jgi:hypothetical protein